MTSMQHQLTPSKVGPRGADPASGVYLKLAFFSVALFAAPLTAYYVSRDRLFGGNPTYAGGLAALVANIVLFAYVVAAFMEDEGDGRARPGKDAQESPSQASKKDQ